jgi:sulfate adenylyltransferase subunit 2
MFSLPKGRNQKKWALDSESLALNFNEEIVSKKIRFRTLKTSPLQKELSLKITEGIGSEANTMRKIVEEVSTMRKTERGK